MRMFEDIQSCDIRLSDVAVVGHRVVHGGNKFHSPTLISEDVLREIEALTSLAPLHNPANLQGIRATLTAMPETPQVAVFDTAFHATMPAHAASYAIDKVVADQWGVRKYGFHGTSHQYVLQSTAALLDKSISEVSLISCHIGNGASIAAIKNGQCIDTSMGMTPLEGLMMGTRSGDIDPGVVFHLARVAGFELQDIDDLLNRQSGLRGIAGMHDMRDVLALADQGDSNALLARQMYVYRIQKYIGSYMTQLPQLDAVVFTAGVGENDVRLRAEVISGLEHMGLALDQNINQELANNQGRFDSTDSICALLVINTKEELQIARLAISHLSHQQ
jgi:acetate kinase